MTAARPTEYAGIELQWPQDPQAAAQMSEFLAELDDPTFVSDDFVGGLAEDPDGEDSGREDLG